MKKSTLFIIIFLLSINLNAQDNKSTPSTKKATYFASASELIFSWGNVTAAPLNTNSIVRFSCFLHIAEQFHYDFSPNVGIYTGLALRNVGFINELNDTVKLKQRVYTLGLPLALKLGNMEKGSYATLGVEGELALAYKQKVFVNDEKSKTTAWFSDRTNLFLPSAFAELKLKSGAYVKFKYYLTDFLTENNQKVNVAGVSFVPTQSQLMYVSVGFVLRDKALKNKVEKTTYDL